LNASSHFLLQIPAQVAGNLRRFWSNRMYRAVGLVFAADSFMFGSWVTHIPYVKSAIGLNDAQLGLALFGLPLGLLAANPISPRLIARFGLAPATNVSAVLMALCFALPIWMPERWTLLGALFLTGAAIAVLNVAMNTCATNIERAEGVHIMSTCHGMWSVGGMVGSAGSAAMIAVGVAPWVHLTAAGLLVAAGAWSWLRPVIAQVPDEQRQADAPAGTPGFVWPNRALLLMIYIGLTVSFCEGVAFDWSAVYLRDRLGAEAQTAALGFTFFSFSMMAMRFTGDALIPYVGERRLLYFTAGASALALAVIILAPSPTAGLLGFLMLGAGVALGAPILFNASARVEGYAQGAGLATYATYSFLGFLIGPPAIGWLAEIRGFSFAFSCTAALALSAAVAVFLLKNTREPQR
jgi:predicted MFS family arabinose efflux permease